MDKTEENLLARKIVAMLWWRQRRAETRWLKERDKATINSDWNAFVNNLSSEYWAASNAFTVCYNALYGKWD